jgi:hypothetical protein
MSRWDAASDRDYYDRTWSDYPREIRLELPPTICATEGCENQADGHKYCGRCEAAQLEHLHRIRHEKRAS